MPITIRYILNLFHQHLFGITLLSLVITHNIKIIDRSIWWRLEYCHHSVNSSTSIYLESTSRRHVPCQLTRHPLRISLHKSGSYLSDIHISIMLIWLNIIINNRGPCNMYRDSITARVEFFTFTFVAVWSLRQGTNITIINNNWLLITYYKNLLLIGKISIKKTLSVFCIWIPHNILIM